jgi:hypothetical protein
MAENFGDDDVGDDDEDEIEAEDIYSVPTRRIDATYDYARRPIGDAGIEKLCRLITVSKDILQRLTLQGQRITSVGATQVVRCLIGSPKFEKLILDENPIGDEGAKEICKLFESKTPISMLSLKRCGITAIGTNAIVDALFASDNVSQLKTLHLGQNNIGYGGTKAFCKLIKSNLGIAGLFLERCNITSNGWEEIYTAMLSSPYYSFIRGVFYIELDVSRDLAYKIRDVANYNQEMDSYMKGTSNVLRSHNISNNHHIRCYSVPTTDLDSMFTNYSGARLWGGVTSIFVFNTPITPEFMRKWFGVKTRHLFNAVETVVFINCGLTPTLEFMALFPRATHFNCSSPIWQAAGGVSLSNAPWE